MPSRRARKEADSRSLTPDQIRRKTFERAIKLLTLRPRSVAELRERLLSGRPASKTAVESAIARLKEYGYLDDERFAIGYASLKVRQKPIGRRRLERELSLKQVDRTIADEALNLVFSETPEAELVDRAIEKRVRLRGRPRTRAEAKSLFDHLLRQGFPFELVSDKVSAIYKGADADDLDSV